MTRFSASHSSSSALPEALSHRVLLATGARSIARAELVQSLWSGYGGIYRVTVEGGTLHGRPMIVKSVVPPSLARHPRGWHSDRSHRRKLRSYQVEQRFYEQYAPQSDHNWRVPRAFDLQQHEHGWTFVFEDLDGAGFPGRHRRLNDQQILACLDWLAGFHARFLGCAPQGLWAQGTYWHLETRPDEWAAMTDAALKQAASSLDQALASCRFRTLVHGDAKVANFCFSKEPGPVAAVDFQYVGGGCGVQDVAYFLSSCFDESELLGRGQHFLDLYFVRLRSALQERSPTTDADAVEEEWRRLYPIAWADFLRFIDGWAPEHPKNHGYSQRMARVALSQLANDAGS